MRTKEKFYENLRKKHVSKEKQIERFEFQDVKTLDGLTAKATSKTKAVTKAVNAELDAGFDWDDALRGKGGTDEMEGKIIAVADYVDDIQKENQKRLSDAKKEQDKVYKQWEKADKKADEVYKKYNKKQTEAKAILSEAKSLVGQIESAISAFESSAKALGVMDKVSSQISKYESIKDKLDLEIQKGT